MYLKILRPTYLVYQRFPYSKVLLSPVNITKFYKQATTAFGISTIVLAVNNADLKSQLDEKEDTTIAPTEATQTPTTTKPIQTPTTTEPTQTPTTTEPPIDMSKYRLPTSAIPISYDLYLYPDLTTGLFKGEITAKTTIKHVTNSIVMHSNQLNIESVLIDDQPANIETDEFFELFTIKKQDETDFIAGSNLSVTVQFDGDMRNRIVGLYRSSYTNSRGEVRYIATSKFEPTYARQAFPCFDEPNMKASYKIHLQIPNDSSYVALSNYPVESSDDVAGGTLVHFQETVPMSTYLACFIVSDFNYTETSFENGDNLTPFRVYATPDQLDKTEYAGYVGKKVIEYYINYFNIPYPLPKLDMVAIPDFVSGAMEHWGLVTYRETALLYTNSTHSASNKQRVAEVVAHELAHSWFGNLVTMDWWNNLWLNEGFASYIEYKGVEQAEPDWQMMEQFLTGTLHSVLSLDATQGSHPIIQTVETPDQITEVFDTISYNKGAAVLRMLEYVVGDDSFKQGVTNYLNKYKYGNAITQNLWDEIQEVVGDSINITEFMDTFTVQMGYPILDVKADGDKYTLTQKRFLKDYETASTAESSPLNYKWSIPVTYITDVDNASQEIQWFNYKSNNLVIDKPAGIKWIKFNPKQVGYYRVNYAEDDWKNLISYISDLSVADRTHLLEESFSIARSGDLSYKIPLDLTKYLIHETEYIPWSVASSQLQQIANYLQNSQYESEFKKYVQSLLKSIYDELGWDDSDQEEPHLKKLARVVIINLACTVDDSDALNVAKSRFNEWVSNNETDISPNLRSIIYKFGMVTAEESTWNLVFDIFAQEKDANEKLKLMNGLANVRNPSLLTKLIELAKDETYVRSQDYFTLLQYIAANPIGAPIVWDYVRENWPQLVDRFTLNDRYLGRLIPSITGKFSTNLKTEEMEHFFTKYPEAGAGATARRQALETVTNNIKWLEKYKTTVEDWIKDNTNNS